MMRSLELQRKWLDLLEEVATNHPNSLVEARKVAELYLPYYYKIWEVQDTGAWMLSVSLPDTYPVNGSLGRGVSPSLTKYNSWLEAYAGAVNREIVKAQDEFERNRRELEFMERMAPPPDPWWRKLFR